MVGVAEDEVVGEEEDVVEEEEEEEEEDGGSIRLFLISYIYMPFVAITIDN